MNDEFSGTELVPGTIIGAREWWCRASDNQLRSAYANYSWQPGVNVARCNTNIHEGPPRLECACGFYAYHDRTRFAGDPSASCNCAACQTTPVSIIAGLIEGFGRVIVGSLGFRAEKARILCFFNHPTVTGFEDVPVMNVAEALARWPVDPGTVQSPPLCKHGQPGPHYFMRPLSNLSFSSVRTWNDSDPILITVRTERCDGPR